MGDPPPQVQLGRLKLREPRVSTGRAFEHKRMMGIPASSCVAGRCACLLRVSVQTEK